MLALPFGVVLALLFLPLAFLFLPVSHGGPVHWLLTGLGGIVARRRRARRLQG